MARAIVNVANGSVGDVRSAMITEAQFQAANGPGWILADGRSVVGTRYAALTGATVAPDMRGQFLRGKNNGRADGNQDPSGERGLGVFQDDAMQGHRHGYPTGTNAGGGGGGGIISAGGTAQQVSVPSTDGVNGTPKTAAETRVKNVAVNYFLKVN